MDEQYLNNLPYYEHLTELQKNLIAERWQIKKYQKGNVIHGCSDECLGQIYMLKGLVRICIISEEGREITLFFSTSE